MPKWINNCDLDFNVTFQQLLNKKHALDREVTSVVSKIISDVINKGDEALFDYTRCFDRFDLNPKNLKVTQEEINKGYFECDPAVTEALKFAYKRIQNFHQRQFPNNLKYIDDHGVSLGQKWTAVKSAGLYVPGGLASYPSSLLMNAIPGLVAKVDRLILCTPASMGKVSRQVLAAAHICGITEIYRIGGAQAIAAMAYGTDTIEPVLKIVGPGNNYVASAKRQVFGQVGIDNIAGPSEIVVVADGKNNSDWIALDLLSQAEHDPAAQAILITDDRNFAEKVLKIITARLKHLDRGSIASESWENFGAIIVVDNFENAIPIINSLAPEHLELAIDFPTQYSEKILNAGAIFLGRYTPEAIGDYVAGPNHVLPTSRSARFSSGLGVLDFMKRNSVVRINSKSFNSLKEDTKKMANIEGLDAHKMSVKIRQRK